MTTSTRKEASVPTGDVVIAAILLATFAFAFVQSMQWPFRTRVFPELLSVGGMAFAALKLVSCAVRARRHHRTRFAEPGEEGDGDDPVPHRWDGQQGQMQAVEYAFGTAGRRAWLVSLAWAAGFFIGLWLLGLFITVPVFTVAYLRISAGVGWIGAIVYAVLAGGLLWLLFNQLLAVPLPAGVF